MTPNGADRRGADRRTVLSTIAGAAAAVSVAGCLGGDESPAAEDEEPGLDQATAVEGDTDPGAWRDVERLRFDGYVGGWLGLEPAAIESVENPTLVLVEGREYEVTWQNKDGIHHNFAFWDDEREVVEGYSTEGTEIEGETETLAFEATPEMDTYRCEYQPVGQKGAVEII